MIAEAEAVCHRLLKHKQFAATNPINTSLVTRVNLDVGPAARALLNHGERSHAQVVHVIELEQDSTQPVTDCVSSDHGGTLQPSNIQAAFYDEIIEFAQGERDHLTRSTCIAPFFVSCVSQTLVCLFSCCICVENSICCGLICIPEATRHGVSSTCRRSLFCYKPHQTVQYQHVSSNKRASNVLPAYEDAPPYDEGAPTQLVMPQQSVESVN